MGLLKKSSKKAPIDGAKGKVEQDDANDPLGLAKSDSPASGSGRGMPKEKMNAREGMENQEHNRIEIKAEKHTKKVKAEPAVIVAAMAYLTALASDVRGIFEQVRPVEQAANALSHFQSQSQEVDKAELDPHAIASLIVYFLRDKEDPVCTCTRRSDIMQTCSLPNEEERQEGLQQIMAGMPAENAAFLRSLRELVLAVSVEHQSFYQDGLETRIDALAQLFGPLLIRPAAAEMKKKGHATAVFARHLFGKASILDPSIPPPASAASREEEAEEPLGGSAQKPVIPKISIPSAMTARAVTFRHVLEKAGGMQTAREAAAKKVEQGKEEGETGIAVPSAAQGKADNTAAEPDRKQKIAKIRFAEEAEDSDETNYNHASTPLDSPWKRHVQSLTDEERRESIAGAVRGGPLLKYSSRGRAVQLMFFKMSSSADSLSWGPVASPDDRKYFLSLHNVELVLPGDLAVGEFAHAGEESQRHLRLVLQLKGQQRLELEALNPPALRMWAVAVQHAIRSHAFFPQESLDPLPFTARDWQRPEPQSSAAASASLSLPLQPAASHGLATARLLEGVGNELEAGGRSGATTSRPARNSSIVPVPAGPATARGPGGRDGPDLTMLNIHVLLSKARHNRREDVVALLDKGISVDAEGEDGNTMLIVACQNNHKRIVKEALRRRCNVNHQNKRGDTCLHFCFALKYFPLGQYLISKGADPSIRNKLLQTCYDRCPSESLPLPASDAEDMEEEGETATSGRERKRRDKEPKLSAVEQEMHALKARMEALEKENSMLRSRTHDASLPSGSTGTAGEGAGGETKRREEELTALAEVSCALLCWSDSRKQLVTPEARGKYHSPSLSEPPSTVQVGGKYERSIASSYDPSRAQQVAEKATDGIGEMQENLKQVHDAIHDAEEVLSKVTSPFAVRGSEECSRATWRSRDFTSLPRTLKFDEEKREDVVGLVPVEEEKRGEEEEKSWQKKIEDARELAKKLSGIARLPRAKGASRRDGAESKYLEPQLEEPDK